MITDLTPEQVVAANVDNQRAEPETLEVEAKIKQAVKGYTFSMKLTVAQKEMMERFALVAGSTWQEFLRRQIDDKILGSQVQVGGPLITGPSFAKGLRIQGPKS